MITMNAVGTFHSICRVTAWFIRRTIRFQNAPGRIVTNERPGFCSRRSLGHFAYGSACFDLGISDCAFALLYPLASIIRPSQ